MNRHSVILTTTAVALVAASCSGGGEEPPAQESADSDVETADTTDDTGEFSAPPEEAVVRVVTSGTFVSPDFGQLETVAGSGSAFIIDPSGLAVTNNHVVAGAASVEVFFDGDDNPIPATIVANSECNDLAVIDLAGDGYAAMYWSQEEASTGLGIRAAGYPDGDEELTLTGGIVARIEDDGATPWASIESLLRHDADLAPGNSGGPILDDDGNVVGVNVAASGDGRYAIPGSVAEPIVDEMRAGVDVDSIGLNAVAVLDEVTNESGVWVVSVEAGSVAAAAGVQPGDVITRVKGVRVGKDATLADYCAVVRSAGAGELPIEVTRGDGFLAGSIRGTGLTPVLAAAEQAVDTATEPPAVVSGPPPPGVPYEEFDTVSDDTGAVSFDLPTEWADRQTSPVFFGGADRPAISAGFDLDALDAAVGTTYDEAGIGAMVFKADVALDEAFEVIIDNSPWMYDCIPLEREATTDPTYQMVVQPFMDCAGSQSMVFSFAVRRIGDPSWLMVNMFARNVADLDAAIRVVETFEFTPNTDAPGADADTDSDADTVEPIPGEATDDPTDRPDGLPESTSSIDLVLDEVGLPPLATDPFTTSSDTSTTVSYSTTASPDEIRDWIDTTTEQIGCEDRFVSSSDEDDLVFYSVGCDLDRGAQLVSYTLRLYASDSDTQVEITVVKFEF